MSSGKMKESDAMMVMEIHEALHVSLEGFEKVFWLGFVRERKMKGVNCCASVNEADSWEGKEKVFYRSW
jgi:hypothetical protein